MYCIRCGKPIRDGEKICPSCGKPVMDSDSSQDVGTVTSTAYRQTHNNQQNEFYQTEYEFSPEQPYSPPDLEPTYQPGAPVEMQNSYDPSLFGEAVVKQGEVEFGNSFHNEYQGGSYAYETEQATGDIYATQQSQAQAPMQAPVDGGYQSGQQMFNQSVAQGYANQQAAQEFATNKAKKDAKNKSNAARNTIVGILVAVLTFGCVYGGLNFMHNFNKRQKIEARKSADEIKMAQPEGDEAVRTLMIYMVGSNLESGNFFGGGGAASADLDEILAAKLPKNVNVVIECGGANEWENRKVPDGEATIFSVEDGKLVQKKSLGRHTMTKEGDLQEFIEYSAEEFPAANYSLILWDHGGGIPVGFGMDELGEEEDLMTNFEIHDELENAGVQFDAVIFDACNMCTLEMGKALADKAEYMVGAESYVNNAGIYYTNWLTMLDGESRDFCEKIVQDYMDKIQEDELVGSMSVIRLDYIEDVYNAYVDYIGDISADVEAGKYRDFARARTQCGSFKYIDSVDLISLTNEYKTDNSSTLMNAAVNAVVYTESDFPYGHGLMVYCPYEYYQAYGDGREAFLKLDYDQSIVNFYDRFMSRELAYLGSDYVAKYGGSWYTGDYSSEVASAGGTASAHQLKTINTGDYYAVELSKEDWANVAYVAETVAVEKDANTLLVLGEDYQYQQDSQGRLALVNPASWTYLNGSITCYTSIEYTCDKSTGEWTKTGLIPVKVNGYDAVLIVYSDSNHPSGTVQGYTMCDFDTMETDPTVLTLSPTDEVDIVYQFLGSDGNYSFVENGSPISASSLKLEYKAIDLDKNVTVGYYTVYDIYGNTYQTDLHELGKLSSVKK